MTTSQSQARTISLLRPLRDTMVTAGETTTFECELSYEGIAVEWFVGTTKVEPSDIVSFRDKYLDIFICLHFWLILLICSCKVTQQYVSITAHSPIVLQHM